MTQLLQDTIARLDLALPWLLPALETVEQTVPASARLSISVVLMIGLVALRHRNAETSTSHLVAL